MDITRKIFSNIVTRTYDLRDFIFDLIFPIECLDCGREGAWLCKECFRALKSRSCQCCLHCKEENQFGQFCRDCRAAYALDGVWIAGDYDDRVTAQLIKNLKYKFIKDISKTLGDYLSLFLRGLMGRHRLSDSDLKGGPDWRKLQNIARHSPRTLLDLKNAIVMPVPLHKKRRRWRGFNQAECIANVLADNFNILINARDLVRIKHKKPQAKLREAERKNNVRSCFIWRGNALAGKNIILVDDVVTTGSTLDECARILKKNGAREVWGLVVAKG